MHLNHCQLSINYSPSTGSGTAVCCTCKQYKYQWPFRPLTHFLCGFVSWRETFCFAAYHTDISASEDSTSVTNAVPLTPRCKRGGVEFNSSMSSVVLYSLSITDSKFSTWSVTWSVTCSVTCSVCFC